MINALIVDDEENVIESLQRLLNLYHPEVRICATCASIPSAIKAIQEQKPDLLFLDVELGAEKGFDLFKHFETPNFKVIFVTGYQQYAIQAFRFSALDYLLKPIDPDLLREALSKASKALESDKLELKINSLLHNLTSTAKEEKKVVLKTAESIHLVLLSDIVYCEADGSYTHFYLSDKTRILVSTTMGDYENLFRDFSFFRIHQSFLLNLSYFKRFDKTDGGKAILKDNSSLPVATRKKDQLLEVLTQL